MSLMKNLFSSNNNICKHASNPYHTDQPVQTITKTYPIRLLFWDRGVLCVVFEDTEGKAKIAYATHEEKGEDKEWVILPQICFVNDESVFVCKVTQNGDEIEEECEEIRINCNFQFPLILKEMSN